MKVLYYWGKKMDVYHAHTRTERADNLCVVAIVPADHVWHGMVWYGMVWYDRAMDLPTYTRNFIS